MRTAAHDAAVSQGGAGPPHVIRRQVLELTVARPLPSAATPAEQGARLLQEEAGRVFHRRVVPAIDRVLSAAGAGGEVVRLGRVELDLGELAPAALEDELVRRTESELAKVLAARLAALGPEPAAGGELRMSAEQAGPRWLRSFLAIGVLPWWVPEAVAADPEAALAELLETSPAALAATLRQAGGRRAARRLVRQFSPPLRRELLALLAAERAEPRQATADWRRLLAEDLPELGGVERRGPEPPTQVTDRWLGHLMAEPAAGAPALSRLAVAALAGGGVEPGAVVRILAPVARRRLPASSAVRVWLEQAGERPAVRDDRGAPPRKMRSRGEGEGAASRSRRETPGPAPGAEPPPGRRRQADAAPWRRPAAGVPAAGRAHHPAGEEILPPALWPPTAPGPPAPAPRAAAPPEEPRLEPGESLFVDDAGLVLLAPYLPAYLARLDLVEERAFVSEPARERAVLLLRYLATGAACAFEHRLPLDKLLCGWPLGEPVARAIEPTPAEEEESTDLLESVVGHWQALKNTSADGLRGSFLAREGRLAENDQGWQLTVARTGYDVLLDQLPWGFATVLLPWMQRPLFVEW